MTVVHKLQLWNNVLSANSLGAGSILPQNAVPVVFDFLNPASVWTVKVEGGRHEYKPGIAGLKNGGLTTESTLSDGKVWQATPFDTIQDTIVLIPGGGSTPDGRADFAKQLLQLQRQANDYQIQSSEYRPVNICVNEVGDVGDRFSQVYDIQWAIDGGLFTDEFANLTLTLTITRYPYWTPVPRGTNPKWYTFLARGLNPEDFLVPSELANFPTIIGGYARSTNGVASSSAVVAEGYTPDIGFGSDAVDWVSGTTANGYIDFGDAGLGIVPIADVLPSTDYLLTYWIRSESSSYDAINLRTIVFDQGGNVLVTGSNFTVTVAANWVKVQQAFTTGVGDTGVAFRIQKNTSATNASYDIYGISVKAASNPMSLIDYGNADPDLQNWVESDVENIWTRTDTANMRLNYLDIAAEDIPGDAPALLTMVQDRNNATNFTTNLYIARRLDCLDDEALYTMTFMAQGSTLASPAGITSTYQSDNARGITSTPGGAASARYAMQFVTGAGAIVENTIATWEFSNLPQGGKFAVFLRGDLTAGAAADIPMYVRLVAPGSTVTAPLTISTISRTLATNGSGNFPSLTYMGVIDATQIKNAIRLANGQGVDTTEYSLLLRFGGRTAGAAATYRVTDILLMPYDDLFATIINVQSIANPSPVELIYTVLDNTGYFNQSSDSIALLYNNRALPLLDTYQIRELQGQSITLEPNRNNRLYFILGSSTGSPTNDSTLAFVTLRTRLNIIPQWRRWRSV